MKPSHSKSPPLCGFSVCTETVPNTHHQLNRISYLQTPREEAKDLNQTAPVNDVNLKLTHLHTARHCPCPGLTSPLRQPFTCLLIVSKKIWSSYNNLVTETFTIHSGILWKAQDRQLSQQARHYLLKQPTH